MKEYERLFADDPAWAARARAFSARVRDVNELLIELGEPRATRHPLHLRVAYHDACHLAHAQGVRQQPRDLLQQIPGIELVAFAEPELCCGSAGIYNLVQPEPARQLGERKVAHIAAVHPDVVATANPGCTLQIQSVAAEQGRPLKVMHPIELIDASISGDRGRRFAGSAASQSLEASDVRGPVLKPDRILLSSAPGDLCGDSGLPPAKPRTATDYFRAAR